MTAVLLLVLGAILGGIGQIAFASFKSFQTSVGIAVSLKSEIESILAVVNVRKYREGLEYIANQLESLEGITPPEFMYGIRVDHDYFGVFHSVQKEIGLLGDCSGAVVRAYTFAKSFLEDMQEITAVRDHPPDGGVPAKLLALRLRAAHDVLVMAIESGNDAVRQLDNFSRQHWLTRCVSRMQGNH